MTISGIHHITAIASDPQKNLNFYTEKLGLRLVKLTVNFDDPGTYHFYFGDETGKPGSILTFFPWPNATRGRRGTGQATAIAFAQQGVVPPRPLTHDLMRDLLDALGAKLRAVRITEMRDSVFYAELVFEDGREVSARPSDAIALALRTGTTIFGTESVLDEAGIEIPHEQEDEDEVEKFREFLDSISPDDFDTTQG